MDVDEDAGVVGRVGAREGDGLGPGTSAALDGELVAGEVELGAAAAAGGVEGDGLGAEEVVAGGGVVGDLDVDEAAAVVHVLVAPEVVAAAPAGGVLLPGVLKDLVPPRRAIGGGSVVDGGEVCHDGPVVGSADGFIVAGPIVVLRRVSGQPSHMFPGSYKGTWRLT